MRRKFKSREGNTEWAEDDDQEKDSQPLGRDATRRSKSSKKRKPTDGRLPAGLPNRFFNEEGEVDLRLVTGRDALKFFELQGIHLPIIPRSDGK